MSSAASPVPVPYLLPLHAAQAGGDADCPGCIHAVFGQCEGLLHAQAGDGGVHVVGVEAHGGGSRPLDGAAAPLPVLLAEIPVGRLASGREANGRRDSGASRLS